MLATARLGILKRIRILVVGVIIIVFSHGATIVFRFLSAGRTALPTAIGFVAITLPFLLWIILACWDQLVAYLGDEDTGSTRHSGP